LLKLLQLAIAICQKYTASIFTDFFDIFPFLEKENYVAVPSVVADNIVTAGGSNFNGFAVEMAHLLEIGRAHV